MMGISLSGFNSLQAAVRPPPERKAIITCCSTGNRFTDDVHYMGGCLLNENVEWSALLRLHPATARSGAGGRQVARVTG